MSRRFWLFSLPIIVVAGAVGVGWALMAREHAPGDPHDAEQLVVGKALYDWNCARCHGEDLGGELGWAKAETGLSDEEVKAVAERLGDVAPAHDDSGSTSRLDDAILFRIIDEGPGEVLNKPDSRMDGFHGRLSEDEIWSIIAYMKSNWQEAKTTAE